LLGFGRSIRELRNRTREKTGYSRPFFRFFPLMSCGPFKQQVAVRAIQVTDFARGLTMRALIGTPRKTLLKEAEEAADLVLQPRRV
jgi:hypothetical protein